MAKFIAQMETGTNWLISQAGEREDQGQARGEQRPEREDQDHQRHRPGDHLRLEHGLEVGLVEVRPEHRGTRRPDGDVTRGQVLQGRLVVVGHPDHLVGVGAGAREQHGGLAVRADRDPRLWGDDLAHARVGLEQGGGGGDRRSPAAGQDVAGRVVDDHLDRGAGAAAEVVDGQLPHRHGLRAVGLPAGSGQLGLHPRGEDPQPDDDQRPDDEGQSATSGDGEAEPAQHPVALERRER
jgi:hypothetical protein